VGQSAAVLADAAASVQGAQGVRPYGGDGVDVRAVAQGDQAAGGEDAEPGGTQSVVGGVWISLPGSAQCPGQPEQRSSS
jgi:hypothetical protein